MATPHGSKLDVWRSLVMVVVLVGTAGTRSAADEAVIERLAAVGAKTSFADGGGGDAGSLVEIVITDGSQLTADDIAVIGRLPLLRKLQIHNCRTLDDAAVASLAGLADLDTLALTNSSLTDAAVEKIATVFPRLTDLDLSSNANMTGAALKWISTLPNLERLGLLQNRFNDLNTRRLAKLQALEVLDLRGNMEAGDLTLDVLGKLPKLRALKHRSTAVTDDGIERIAASGSLTALLMQDFAITDAAASALARIGTLESLEIFRCQGFGSEGLRALAPLKKLGRLSLRDLPMLDDAGLEVLADLPALTELSLRETGVTDAGLAKIAALPGLESLTFLDNGPISPATREKLAARTWKKLDLGAK